MKKLVGVVVVFSILLLSNEECITNDGFQSFQLEFDLDTTNSNQIGYRPGYPGIGPKSIALGTNCVFIIDDFHSNIKRIDLLTGEMTVSDRVSGREYCWPVDAVECRGHILVSDSFDSIFVFDSSLTRHNSVYAGERDERYFLREDGGGLLLYSALHNTVSSISCLGEIGTPRDTTPLAPGGGVDGKPFSLIRQNGETLLQTEYFAIPLANGAENISQAIDYLDCIYLDYDSSRVVYFNLREGSLVLHCYQRTGE